MLALMSDGENTLDTSDMFNLILEHVRSIDARINSMDARFNAVEEENRFIKQGIINIGTRMDSFEQRLEVVESAIKEDSLTTQPKLDAMQVEIAGVRAETKARFDTMQAEMQERFDALQAEIAGVRAEMRERFDAMQTEARDTNRRMRGLTKYMLDLIGEHEKLEDRIEKLEHQPS